MSRTRERLFGQARAQWKRLSTAVRTALTTDTDVTRDRRAADSAEVEELLRTAGRMRGGLAKIAQLRAYLELEDGLGPEARARLAALWDRVPPDPPQAIRAVVEEDLGAPIATLFAAWQDDPIAAASLGQVHAARLPDGTEVAVKVQYPGIAAALDDDLASPGVVRDLIGPGLGAGAERAALDTLRAAIARELDYVAERGAIERFGRAFFGDRDILLPRPIAERSSARVLTMTRLPGVPLSAFVAAADAAARTAAARTLFRFALGAPLRHGLCNGDPHPGNYLVDAAAPAGRVGFVDFGFVVELGALAEIDRRLFLAMVHRDGEALRYAAHEEGLVPRVGVFDHGAWRDFERALGKPFLARGERSFGPAEAGALAGAFSRLVRAGAVRLAPEAVVLWRQRIGFFTVLGSLEARLDLRRLLCEVLDDGRHPTPLYERYL
jgi:predicted unusual protein kinase regulating ubiquinone biosynthesis (AarF/ABC1/UbiB family)